MYLNKNKNKKKRIGDSIVSLGETRKKKLCVCFDLIYLWYRLNFILCYPTEVLKTHLPKHLNLVRTYRQNSSASFFFFPEMILRNMSLTLYVFLLQQFLWILLSW